MEHATLSELIDALEHGTKIHISITFLDECGNRKTQRTQSQSIHSKPVCMTIKRQYNGLGDCYRCRNIVQKAVIQRRRSMGGLCTNGVYEYCRPVIYNNRVICVIFIGNILTSDPVQRKTLENRIGSKLLETMEQHSSPEDCIKIADVLESYIVFLFNRYGIENKEFDPLVENIKNYVRENMEYGFSMNDLSAIFNYTPKYLGHIFKERTGKTIKEYYNYLRVEQAKILLADTDMSISTIVYRTGFNSLTYFDRVFHKQVSLSPQTYRTSVKKQKHAGKNK